MITNFKIMTKLSKNTELQQSCITDVSGSINITNGLKMSQKQIHISTSWANVDYYSLTINNTSISIKKCYLEIPKNAKKLNKSSHIFVQNTELKNGRYFFDEEESSEDEVVVYYR